jgi:hypothetical protein
VPAPRRPDPEIEALIHAAVRSSAPDTDRLSALRAQCWPGGDDRLVRAAREWLRRWGPRCDIAALPVCSCRSGRCGLCN